jgi:galactokinase
MKASLFELIATEFRARLGSSPRHIVRAPGRVNLIGEHTDYDDDFVMPMAIDRAMWIALRPRNHMTGAGFGGCAPWCERRTGEVLRDRVN